MPRFIHNVCLYTSDFIAFTKPPNRKTDRECSLYIVECVRRANKPTSIL